MGEARQVMDRLTDAFLAGDYDAVRACYSPNVVVTTPDAGTLTGIDQFVDYMRQLDEAFPEMRYVSARKLETGYCAIDQGVNIGRQTGPLRLPDGRSIPATGKEVRMRSCDIAVVEDGVITKHDFYFDQMELAVQLGVLEELAATMP